MIDSRPRFCLFCLALLLATAVLPAAADLKTNQVHKKATKMTGSQGASLASVEAKRWGLSEKEWLNYQEIMLGQGRFFWADTDPITVLGIYAESDAERERYAEMLAIQEYELQKKFLALNDAYLVAIDRLVGDEPILNMAKFDKFYNRNGSSASLGTRKARGKGGIFGRDAGNRIVLFVSSDCSGCADYYKRVRRVQAFGVAMDIFFVNTTDQQIIDWARQLDIDPTLVSQGVITLNRDQGNYARYGKPSLPIAYYYDANAGKVSVLGVKEGGS